MFDGLVKKKIKQVLRKVLHSIGYEARKVFPPPKLVPIDVFRLVVEDLMRRMEGAGDQFFCVQIGAHDGLHYDPIRAFIKKHHWRGLLVEPQPEVYRRLVANYSDEPQLVFENAAVASKDGFATLYAFKKTDSLPDHATMLASFNKDALLYNGHGYKGEIEELSVPALTFNTLLAKHQIGAISLLQIDTEGYDFEIIKMLEGSEVRPVVIHFESACMYRAQLYECGETLHRMGYRALTIGIDTIAYRQSEDDFAERFENKGYG
jgi:FkbM family methyltransferase